MTKILYKFNDFITIFFVKIAASLTALMTIVILTQVFFRYFLNNALPWPEEAARFMMVWLTFLVAPYAYKRGMNVNIEIIFNKLPNKIKTMAIVLTNILIGFISVILTIEAFKMTARGISISATSINLNLVYVYAILPVSFISITLISLEKILKLFPKGFKS